VISFIAFYSLEIYTAQANVCQLDEPVFSISM